MAKTVLSVTCNNCDTKFRTQIRKGGRLTRKCPECNSDQVRRNEPEPESGESDEYGEESP